MTGVWYQWYYALWCLSWGLLGVVVNVVVRRCRLGDSIALYIPLLALSVFVVVFIPLVVFGVVH
jgi:hypothetical protein